MVSLATIYQDARQLGVALIPYSIGFADAATLEMDGRYGIFLDFDQFETMADYAAALAHEVGHCATGATHAVHSPFELVAQHEDLGQPLALRALPALFGIAGAGGGRLHRALAAGGGHRLAGKNSAGRTGILHPAPGPAAAMPLNQSHNKKSPRTAHLPFGGIFLF